MFSVCRSPVYTNFSFHSLNNVSPPTSAVQVLVTTARSFIYKHYINNRCASRSVTNYATSFKVGQWVDWSLCVCSSIYTPTAKCEAVFPPFLPPPTWHFTKMDDGKREWVNRWKCNKRIKSDNVEVKFEPLLMEL